MPSTPETALLIALIALLGTLANVLVNANNARKRGELDKKLVQIKAQLDQLNAVEIAKIQADLNERLNLIEFNRAQMAADDARKRTADTATLSSIIKILEPDNIIAFLREHDFGGIFNRDDVAPLHRFIDHASRPDQEFLIPELEEIRLQLLISARELSKLIGATTYPRHGSFNSVLPENLVNSERTSLIYKNAANLNAAATNFVDLFDKLVRKSRNILGA